MPLSTECNCICGEMSHLVCNFTCSNQWFILYQPTRDVVLSKLGHGDSDVVVCRLDGYVVDGTDSAILSSPIMFISCLHCIPEKNIMRVRE